MLNDILIPISSSFVKRRLKLKEDRGSGESKLFLGSKKRENELDLFFENYSKENEYYFSKENLLNYLKYTLIEFFSQKCNKYKDINIEYYNEKFNYILTLNNEIKFDITKFIDNSRYYIRPNELTQKLFDSIIREIALPKITNLKIVKNNKKYEFLLMLNYDEIQKRNIFETTNHERKENSHTYQKIFFGAPGTGKSYKVSKLIEETFGKDENLIKNNVIRTTIYQDYSYYDFIGNIMPENDGTQIKYVFKPGPLTEALTKAFENENEDIFLVIEEMSRGNIASIFGDIFQLLDRENGVSQYPIDNSLISQYIEKELTIDDEKIKNGKIYLPSNLHILGTVNTSDQNVNVMDTAFKRRFLFEYVDTKPVYDEEKNPLNDFKFELLNEKFNWIKLYQNLNKFIVEDLELSEDKQLGQFFLKFTENEEENYEQLNNKLLQYLWEDVVLASISDNVKLFDDDIKTFSNLYEKFKNREQIFSEVFIKKYGNYFGVGDELENEKVIG